MKPFKLDGKAYREASEPTGRDVCGGCVANRREAINEDDEIKRKELCFKLPACDFRIFIEVKENEE